jgi:hypothetical protein
MNSSVFTNIRDDFTDMIVDILAPHIYAGLTKIYNDSQELAINNNQPKQILILFQNCLGAVSKWNTKIISDETNNIKQNSGTSDYLEELVRAIARANIILLTYSNEMSSVVVKSFFDSLTLETFIHQCYVICARDALNNPYLYYAEAAPMDYKRNQLIIKQQIQEGIRKATKKILPISLILKEFMTNTVSFIYPNENSKIVSDKKLLTDGSKELINRLIANEKNKNNEQKVKELIEVDKAITEKVATEKVATEKKLTTQAQQLKTIHSNNLDVNIAKDTSAVASSMTTERPLPSNFQPIETYGKKK